MGGGRVWLWQIKERTNGWNPWRTGRIILVKMDQWIFFSPQCSRMTQDCARTTTQAAKDGRRWESVRGTPPICSSTAKSPAAGVNRIAFLHGLSNTVLVSVI